ncbi:MAG: CBS domain-containing protein [Eubacteriaceae bacterium]|nr:CBS domain-containing protein [Eubacteriaceae bacterium]
MFVENVMNTDLITLKMDSSIADAVVLMNKNRIRHLPVIDDNKKLVGIISDRDIRDASPSILNIGDKSYLHQPVSDIMTRNVITGSPLDFIEDVASSFYEYKISCLPITKNDILIGIVTETDLFRTFIELTGAHQPGSRIEIRISNQPGGLSAVSAIIAQHNINIISVFVYPDKDQDYRILVIRLQVMNPTSAVKDLISKGYDVLWPKI